MNEASSTGPRGTCSTSRPPAKGPRSYAKRIARRRVYRSVNRPLARVLRSLGL